MAAAPEAQEREARRNGLARLKRQLSPVSAKPAPGARRRELEGRRRMPLLLERLARCPAAGIAHVECGSRSKFSQSVPVVRDLEGGGRGPAPALVSVVQGLDRYHPSLRVHVP